MSKSLYIAEKPSVAREFAKALQENMKSKDGYMESENAIVTWCVGHLVTMSYPEVYDEKYKKWSLSTLPFLPEEFKYEVIPGVKKQFDIVSGLLNRPDVSTIYVCTDSGREGEYIYRLVEQMAGVKGKERRRVWIDSQTEEEILRGIREAKDLSAYDNLSESAYLRAKEDYLMGINFSRLLTLKYGNTIASFLNKKYTVISVGRVMTCVLGMVVRREREIREFVKTPFYRVLNTMELDGMKIEGEWKAVEGSQYFQSPKLYRENGFKEKEDAVALIQKLVQGRFAKEDENKYIPAAGTDTEATGTNCLTSEVTAVEKKKERKNPPLLYNLAELQNDCSKMFKISPDETLRVVQELYEKKLVTYPRTDARVLSTAVCKEIYKNIKGLEQIGAVRGFAEEIIQSGSYKGIAKTRYCNDKMITDHYAIIPTGQGISAMKSLNATALKVYETIVRRFLAIFFPQAVYQKVSLTTKMQEESFFASFKVLESPGYLKVMEYSFKKKKETEGTGKDNAKDNGVADNRGNADQSGDTTEDKVCDADMLKKVMALKKGAVLPVTAMEIKEGETSPPKRYNSGSMILAMENAGQLIEDEELRAQIKGSGIGTSATRAEILKKLVNNKYLDLNKKTQIITPTLQGEMIFDVVAASIKSLLNPELTASWEKGLTYVAEGTISPEEYMGKLEHFIKTRTAGVLGLRNQGMLNQCFLHAAQFYRKGPSENRKKKENLEAVE
ncbi:MAG: DNA topoisomerase [Agathobacter sp.]